MWFRKLSTRLQAAGALRIAGELRHVALSHRLELLGGSDEIETGPARSVARRQPGRGRSELPATDLPNPSGWRRAPRFSGASGRAGGLEPARARGVHAAALRGTIDRRNQPDARSGHERGEAQRVPRGQEAAGGACAATRVRIVKHYQRRRADALLLRRRTPAARTSSVISTSAQRARVLSRDCRHARDDCRARRPRARRSVTASKSGSASGIGCPNADGLVVRSPRGSMGSGSGPSCAAAAAILVLVGVHRRPDVARRGCTAGSLSMHRQDAAADRDHAEGRQRILLTSGRRSPRSIRARADGHHERAGLAATSRARRAGRTIC